jgi:predicted amidohydrolase YtcJ
MPNYADILITNARVFTGGPAAPDAEAVAIRGNRIVFIGSNYEAKDWRGKITRVIDAQRKTLMPGFIDCHFHMLMGSLALEDFHPDDIVEYVEFVKKLKAFSNSHPDNEWLTGFGLQYNVGPNHTPLHREHLDAVVDDRPVYIIAYDGHTAWVNTIALKKAGIFNGGECGENSEIVLDGHGEATGELREQGAREGIETLLPIPNQDEKSQLLQKGLKLASSFGITSIHNMDGDLDQISLYSSLEETGELSVRIYASYSVSTQTSNRDLEDVIALKHEYHSDILHVGSIKLFMDGVIEAYTGLLVDEYADCPGTYGKSNYETALFNKVVLESDSLGLQIFTHSVGDGGVRRVLDAYAAAAHQNGHRDRRHRIEHIEVIHPDDIHRFAKSGVIASMQPLHAPPSVDSGDIWLSRVGEKRWPYSFAWSTLRNAGATLVFGSDWPIVSQNPFMAIHNTLNRSPWKEGLLDHRQSLTESLLSYTRDAAYAEFQEKHKGQIKPGYLADVVVLSDNIFNISPDRMNEVHPLLTIMNGNIVYED